MNNVNASRERRKLPLAEQVLLEAVEALEGSERTMREAGEDHPYAGVGDLLADGVALWHEPGGAVHVDMRHGLRVRMVPGLGCDRARLQIRSASGRSCPVEGASPDTASKLLALLRRYAHYREWRLPARADHASWMRVNGILESTGRTIEAWLEREHEQEAGRQDGARVVALFNAVRRVAEGESSTSRIRASRGRSEGRVRVERLDVIVGTINEWHNHHLSWYRGTVSSDESRLEATLSLSPGVGPAGGDFTPSEADPVARTALALTDAMNRRNAGPLMLRYRTGKQWRHLLEQVAASTAWTHLPHGDDWQPEKTEWTDLAEEPVHRLD